VSGGLDPGPAPLGGRVLPALRPAARAWRTGYAAPVLTLLALTLSVAVFSPSFISPRSLAITADAVAPILLLALAETIVILMGSIDLSVHAIASLASVAAAMLLTESWWLAAPAGIAVGLLCGLTNGLFYTVARIPSFIATLGTLGLWTGVSLTVTGASTVPISGRAGLIDWLQADTVGVPNTAILALATLALVSVVLRLTPLGRYVYAIGIGESATWLSGVPVRRYKLLAFALSGTCAGLAGIVLAAQVFSGGPSVANNLLLPAIAAVIIGGTAITGGVGGAARTLIGSLIIIVARIGMDAASVDIFAQQVVYGVVVILAVTLTIDRAKIVTIK